MVMFPLGTGSASLMALYQTELYSRSLDRLLRSITIALHINFLVSVKDCSWTFGEIKKKYGSFSDVFKALESVRRFIFSFKSSHKALSFSFSRQSSTSWTEIISGLCQGARVNVKVLT